MTYDPSEEICRCGYKRKLHGSWPWACSAFDRSHSFNGGKVVIERVKGGPKKAAKTRIVPVDDDGNELLELNWKAEL